MFCSLLLPYLRRRWLREDGHHNTQLMLQTVHITTTKLCEITQIFM